MGDDDNRTEQQSFAEEWPVHYEKSNLFRVTHVDGAYGRATQAGLVQAGFYSERQPIPQTVYQAVDSSSGRLLAEVTRVESRNGLLREIELIGVMTADVAEQIGRWLVDKAAEARAMETHRQPRDAAEEEEA